MAIEFGAFALIALFVIFIIERIYRKVLDNERQIDMQRNKFRVLEQRLRKQAEYLKLQAQKSDKKPDNASFTGNDVKRCENCGKYYAASLGKCPYCS